MNDNQILIDEIESIYKENLITKGSYNAVIKLINKETITVLEKAYLQSDINMLKAKHKISNDLADFILTGKIPEHKENETKKDDNKENPTTSSTYQEKPENELFSPKEEVIATARSKARMMDKVKDQKIVKNSKNHLIFNVIGLIVGFLILFYSVNELIINKEEELWQYTLPSILQLIGSLVLIIHSIIAITSDGKKFIPAINFYALAVIAFAPLFLQFIKDIKSGIGPTITGIFAIIAMLIYALSLGLKLNTVSVISCLLIIIGLFVLLLVPLVHEINIGGVYSYVPISKNEQLIIWAIIGITSQLACELNNTH